MTRRLVSVLAMSVAVSLVGGACSQGERQRYANAISGAAKLAAKHTMVGRLVVSVRPDEIDAPPELAALVRTATLSSLAVTLDRAHRRAALAPAPGAPPIVLFQPEIVYARRVTRTEADRRKWARFEYEKLPDVDVPSLRELSQATGPGDVAVVDPVFVTDLLAGVLTGSVKLVKTSGDGSRLFSFNTSIDKAARKLRVPEDERKQRTKLLRSLAITGDVHEAEVILHDDGSVSSVRVLFSERPDKRTKIHLEATLTLVTLGADEKAVSLESPPRDVTVRVPALTALKGTIQDQLVASGGRL